MKADLDERLAAWTLAESTGDAGALTALLHPEFVGVGPFGFVLSRDQWTQRFAGGLHYIGFDFVVDVPVRQVGDIAVVVGTQTQAGTHQGRPIDGAFRVTLTFVDGTLLGIHLSLRNPPGTGA